MSNFDKALKFTLRWEGGYSNHPADKGGETNFGITHTTYNNYRQSKGLPMRSVRLIDSQEVADIYKWRYWQPAGCELLPPHLAMCHFDWAVNAGVNRAVRTLQQVVGTTSDGIIGPKTKAAIANAVLAKKEAALCHTYCAVRESLYTRWATGDQRVFFQGWMNRLNALRKELA